MTLLTRRTMLGAAALGAARTARAQTPTLRIGVLTDLSGPYRDTGGPTVAACIRQAIEDFGASQKGLNVEIITADHLQKPDVAAQIVREWFDRGDVDVVTDVNNSAIAFAVNDIVQAKNKVHLNTGAVSADLTGVRCSPNLIHWECDTWQISKNTGGAVVRAGGDSWFFITADYAFGAAMQRDLSRFIENSGGKVLGAAVYPFPGTTDFSSYLLQAQASGAKVIALANAAGDFVNSVKQAAEFGVTRRGTKLAGLVVFITDIHALGLQVAQGLVLTEIFYWDLNERTRAFAARVKPKTPTNMPNQEHASAYSAALHYLKVAHEMGAARAKASGVETVAAMKRMPTDDDCFGPGVIREDGRKIHPVHLFEVKRPEESTSAWDCYKLIATTPADQAWRPLAEGKCPLVRS